MRFIIVGHPARARQALKLAFSLGGHVVMDNRNEGAYANHVRALRAAAHHHGHVTILEDDALPVDGYEHKLNGWVARFPDQLISSYLGTSHPRQWMRQVDQAWDTTEDHVILPQLIHAVAVTYPPGAPAAILEQMQPSPHVDYSIGDAWRGDIIYPKASLVDHADQAPVIQGRATRSPRRARALA